MFHLRLCKGISYSGVVSATKKAPDVFVEDDEIAKVAVTTGYFKLVEGDEILTPPKPPTDTITKFDVMNATQLKKYAKANNIDIGEAAELDEIRAIIITTEQSKGDVGDDDPINQFVGGDNGEDGNVSQ